MEVVRHAETQDRMDAELIFCEHCTARRLMQQIFQASFLTTRETSAITIQILRDPATVPDISESI